MKQTIFKRLVIGNLVMIGLLIILGLYLVYRLNALKELTREIDGPDSEIQAMIVDTIRMTAWITLASVALGGLISLQNTRAVTASLSSLKEKTREIVNGRFHPISLVSNTPGEIENLIRHFNAMCARLTEMEVMKSDFISHFSHTLRTPVTSIKEAGSMLETSMFESDPGKRRELYELIRSECDRLNESIEKILDLSRMEMYRMEYSFDRTSINALVERVSAVFLPMAAGKGIDLSVLPGSGLPETKMDIRRIEEVLHYLILNALKYTSENGAIQVKTRSGPDSRILVSVSDNGCGMDRENLGRIFEKFKRIENGNDILRGTGLGLAMAKHIIKAHKGTIWAESEISKGTIVSFSLPVV